MSLQLTMSHHPQIKITDVHIRYEDEEACPGVPFAVGMTVESISAQTTNDQWVSGRADGIKAILCVVMASRPYSVCDDGIKAMYSACVW